MKQFIADLLKGPNNRAWDLARVIGAKAAIIYPMPVLYGVFHSGTMPDPIAWGSGYAAVLLAIGGMIGVKDVATAKANATPPAA